MISIRGAITVDEDEKIQVLKATRNLLEKMIHDNSLNNSDIISIVFTCTKDIKSVYPAVAARDIGIVDAGLMCMNEMYVEGSLQKCLRVLMLANKDISQGDVKHIYMGNARVLRPDLCEND